MCTVETRQKHIHWLDIRSGHHASTMPSTPYTFGHTLSHHENPMPKAKERTSDFGARLTTLRKAAAYTQVELAATLGTTQRMIAYYESRAEKAPAALLPQMAAALGVSADELLGIKPVKKSRKPDTQLHRRMQRIEKLDPKAKRQITQLLDTFIEREELKQRVSAQGV